MTLPLCAVTNAVRYNIDFRTEALNRIEIVEQALNLEGCDFCPLLWFIRKYVKYNKQLYKP